MAIDASLIGRLGGGGMEQVPATWERTGASWTTAHEFIVPAEHLGVLAITGTQTSTTSSDDVLRIGGTMHRSGEIVDAVAVRGPTTILIEARGGAFGVRASSFSGTIHQTLIQEV